MAHLGTRMLRWLAGICGSLASFWRKDYSMTPEQARETRINMFMVQGADRATAIMLDDIVLAAVNDSMKHHRDFIESRCQMAGLDDELGLAALIMGGHALAASMTRAMDDMAEHARATWNGTGVDIDKESQDMVKQAMLKAGALPH